ncbi:MAG: L-ascorbate metabolism protein UlaG (beta-lactamase superfamily) [Thermoproteota archaeon]|jgi:L-ascorbate metabolism protein UlaG (beta-lactamase superfamily)
MQNLKLLIMTLLFLSANSTMAGDLRIYWTGVAGIYITDGDSGLMFDPVFDRPMIYDIPLNREFIPNLKNTKRVLKKLEANKVDAIFHSHTHHDHYANAPLISKLKGAQIYGSLTSRNLSLSSGIEKKKTTVISIGSKYKVGEFEVEILESHHGLILGFLEFLPGELKEVVKFPLSIWDYKMGGAFSFIIKYKDQTFLFQQASRYTDDLKKRIAKENFDIIFQGIANRESTEDLYNNVWKVGHAKVIIPVHHDNFLFQLTNEKEISLLPLQKMDEFREFMNKKGLKYVEPMYYENLATAIKKQI